MLVIDLEGGGCWRGDGKDGWEGEGMLFVSSLFIVFSGKKPFLIFLTYFWCIRTVFSHCIA